ncbi:hypothetical protein ABE096_02095 [Robertmurraya massiliosenegalensis]|uniref:hypothetical protein n=1 Tax=Robertmurraya TaxID=2837507 RepID=UPI0039A6C77E
MGGIAGVLLVIAGKSEIIAGVFMVIAGNLPLIAGVLRIIADLSLNTKKIRAPHTGHSKFFPAP